MANVAQKVAIIVERIYEGNIRYIEAAGPSLETKPTEDILTGSIFTETDTGKVYFFQADGAGSGEWVEQFSFQG